MHAHFKPFTLEMLSFKKIQIFRTLITTVKPRLSDSHIMSDDKRLKIGDYGKFMRKREYF
ncbi:hypothetical protein LLID5_15750 [Lactococcus lactis]|nr:hypothetical protein LLID5_15750 [Lactococcus lactis]